MKMTENDMRIFHDILKPYLTHAEVQKMRDYIAHGKITVLRHSLDVAKEAYLLNKKYGWNADLHTLLVGALLHDFYGYDWHSRPLSWNIFKMHGFTHPEAARKHASEVFGVDEKIQNVIVSHMWPLTLRSFPQSKEARIICLADKICATKETVFR